MKDKTEAQEFFINDIYATKTTGIKIIDAHENYSKCSLEINESHFNAGGRVMGGAIFTLADFAFAVASNSKDSMCVTLTSQITYLNPSLGNKLIAESKCEKSGRTTCSFRTEIYDGEALIAVVASTGFKIKK